MRRCCMCRQEKPEADFAFRWIATGVRQDHCRACHAAYRRQHYLDNREAYIRREVARMKRYREQNRVLLLAYLRSHPCVDCGQADPVLLEFDHRDPATKRREVGRLSMTKRWEVVATEVAKCDVRCAACHRQRTARQLNWGSRSNRAIAKPQLERLTLTGTRVCTGCLTSKPSNQFSIKNKVTGRQATRCLTCVAAASRLHYEKNRESYLARSRVRLPWNNPKISYRREYLATHPCVDCGEVDPLLLEFDHRAGEDKVDDVSRLIQQRSWAIVQREIAKCDVRCVSCHRRKTAHQFGWSRLGEESMMYAFAGVL